MVFFEGQSMVHFVKKLPEHEECRVYLDKIKSKDGFTGIKCGHIFHEVNFGLHNTLCALFKITTSSKSVSNILIGKRFEIYEEKACYFMRKVSKSLQNS